MDVNLPQHQHRGCRTPTAGRGRLVPGVGIVAILFAVALAAGCSGGPSPGSDSSAPPPATPTLWPDEQGGLNRERSGCGQLAGPARRGGILTVAVLDTVRVSRAPIPATTAERLVFAQLYETLVRVDCQGSLEPGLAAHWSCTADSTVWIFVLRPEARFWDGSPVTAGDVRMAWRNGAARPRDAGRAVPWDWLDAAAGSVEPLDARRLRITLPEPQAELPRLLAHPATSVAVHRAGWTWPVGSGPARLRASTPPPLPELRCRPNPQHPEVPTWQELVFRVAADRDVRDLVDTGFDVAITRELAAVRFYGDAPGYRVDPLPWDRLYLLVCPPETNPDGGERWATAANHLEPQRSVTTVAASPWSGIVFPAGGRRDCPQVAGPVPAGDALRRDSDLARTRVDGATLVYGADEPGARELAGRLAALVGAKVRTAPLAPASLQAALRWQMPGALILPLDYQFPTPCLQLASLLGQAPWLQDAALRPRPTIPRDDLVAAEHAAVPPRHPAEALRAAGLVRPLLLSRPWLVTRGELAGFALDFDGTPRLTAVGRAAVEPEAQP